MPTEEEWSPDVYKRPRYASREFCRGGLLDYKKIDTFADENIRSYEIRCFGNSQNVGMLSGGNMQKVVAVSYTHLDVYKRQPLGSIAHFSNTLSDCVDRYNTVFVD